MDDALEVKQMSFVSESAGPLKKKDLRVDHESMWYTDDKANIIINNARQPKPKSDNHAYNLHGKETRYNNTDSPISMVECINWLTNGKKKQLVKSHILICGALPLRMRIVSTVVMIVPAETP